MKSKLKKIYDARDYFDILNKPSYFLTPNPIYQVNNFIVDANKKMNGNFLSNLNDLNILSTNEPLCKVDYDYNTNTLYCNDRSADVYGLLHVASNNRRKQYTGIILNSDVGYGINNGLTETFTHNINGSKFSYPLEAVVAEVLLTIDSDLMYYSYFSNNGSLVMLLNNKVEELMRNVDKYHDNTIELNSLYKELFALKCSVYKNNEYKNRLECVNEKMLKLEYDNFATVYNIFNLLVDIISNSKLSRSDKQKLLSKTYYECEHIFSKEEMSYLLELIYILGADTSNNVKKKVK